MLKHDMRCHLMGPASGSTNTTIGGSTLMANASNETRTHSGSCHCGAVKFEVQIDATAGSRCNCTVCTKIGALGGIVKPDTFRLLSGEPSLSFYEWGGKTAKRYF